MIREPMFNIQKWLQCDQYKHWVHLVYSTEKRVIRKRVVFCVPVARVISTEIMLSIFIFNKMSFNKKNNLIICLHSTFHHLLFDFHPQNQIQKCYWYL
jgi:hypothetical protein